MKNENIITLCGVCRKDFKNGTTNKLRRTDNENREPCNYCNFRMGYDYKIIEPKGGAK
jgi:hypothetical protein